MCGYLKQKCYKMQPNSKLGCQDGWRQQLHRFLRWVPVCIGHYQLTCLATNLLKQKNYSLTSTNNFFIYVHNWMLMLYIFLQVTHTQPSTYLTNESDKHVIPPLGAVTSSTSCQQLTHFVYHLGLYVKLIQATFQYILTKLICNEMRVCYHLSYYIKY